MRKIVVLLLAGFMAAKIPSALAEGWAKSEKLKCGMTEVSLKSTCIIQIDGEPPHCDQNLAFNSNKYPVRKISYSPARASKGDEPFVSRVSCLNIRGTKYVITQSTNFGNCAICEWKDIFDESGRYLGSTPSISWALDFPRKRLPGGSHSFFAGQSEERGVDISRVR